MPGTQGGVNYYGGAFDPKLGLFVVNVNNLGQPMRIIRSQDGGYINSGPLAGYVRFWDPSNHLPCGPTPWGQLVAVDVNTGKIAWRSTLGVTSTLPAGKQNTGRPGLGGRHRYRQRPDLHRRHRRWSLPRLRYQNRQAALDGETPSLG